jgi:putative membrane protein
MMRAGPAPPYVPGMWRVRELVFSLIANAIALVVVIAVLDKVEVGSVGDLINAALLFGILNTFLKPLVKLVTLPLAIITLRLAWFFVAMLMLKLTALFVGGFDIHGLRALFWATLIIWIVNLVLDLAPGPWRGTRRGRRAIGRRRPA